MAPGSPRAFSAIRLFDVTALAAGLRPRTAAAATGAAVGSRAATNAFSTAVAANRAVDRTGNRQVGVGGVCVDPRVEGIRAWRSARGAAFVRVRGVATALVVGAVGVGFRLGAEA